MAGRCGFKPELLKHGGMVHGLDLHDLNTKMFAYLTVFVLMFFRGFFRYKIKIQGLTNTTYCIDNILFILSSLRLSYSLRGETLSWYIIVDFTVLFDGFV